MSRYEKKGGALAGQIDPDQVAGVVADLRKAFRSEKTYSKEWRRGQLNAMKKMILEAGEEICDAMKKDLHKSNFESKVVELALVISEIDTALSHLDQWMAPEVKDNTMLNYPCWSSTIKDPLGVIMVYSAWNYPAQLALAPMVAAIAAGNCVIMKPGSYATATSSALASVCGRYLDQECIRVVEGNREVTGALMKEKFDKVFFTGSGFVGKLILKAAAEHLTPCVLELGGKSPCIVDKSADLEHAAQRAVWGAFINSGQTCVRPDFVMVHKDVADQFFVEVKKKIVEMYTSDPQKTEYFGRLINDSAFKRLSALAEKEKDRLVTGGNMDAADKYIEPSVFDFKEDMEAFKNSELMKDELFGPLMPAYRFSHLDEVVEFIKDLSTGKPLALYAFGSDPSFINTIKTRTTSGGLCINDALMHLSNHNIPFGGVGESGMGNYHGKYGFDAMSHEKAVLEKSQLLDQSPLFKPLLAARFPPYTPFKKTLVGLFGAQWTDVFANPPSPYTILKLLFAYIIFKQLGFRITRD